jgi:hypothetical protein
MIITLCLDFDDGGSGGDELGGMRVPKLKSTIKLYVNCTISL